nr:uncharacterized protein LOC113802542 [Penaeus vannamei]
MAPTHVHHAIPTWIEENKKFFLPPVCNKMIYGVNLCKYCTESVQHKDSLQTAKGISMQITHSKPWQQLLPTRKGRDIGSRAFIVSSTRYKVPVLKGLALPIMRLDQEVRQVWLVTLMWIDRCDLHLTTITITTINTVALAVAFRPHRALNDAGLSLKVHILLRGGVLAEHLRCLLQIRRVQKWTYSLTSLILLQVFLLPGKIPHSPQRFAETIGLVIERERMKTELDGLRYYVEGTTDSLFERWFYCEDLGSQLGPIIKEYFASEQHKTGKPIPGTIPENPPFAPDAARKLEDPFPLAKWLTKHSAEIHQEGSKRLFDLSYQSDVTVFGRGTSEVKLPRAETWLWQLEGETAVTTGGKMVKLKPQDSLLLRADSPYSLTRTEGALTLSVVMDPGSKERGFAHLKKKE